MNQWEVYQLLTGGNGGAVADAVYRFLPQSINNEITKRILIPISNVLWVNIRSPISGTIWDVIEESGGQGETV